MTHYNFQIESLKEILEKEDITQILVDNWMEVEDYKDSIKLDVDWNKYVLLEELGMLGLYTMRTNQNKIAGYCLVFADNNLHHKNDVFARIDTLYIKPEHRKYGSVFKFLKFVIDHLKGLNVSVLSVNIKAHHQMNKLLSRLGFDELEVTHALLLKKG